MTAGRPVGPAINEKPGTAARESIRVYRDDDGVLIRSEFSADQDLVIHVCRVANEESYLISKESSITDYKQGLLLHPSGDDYPASWFGAYHNLGGNHGSPYARVIQMPNHGMTEKDIGTRLTDEKKHVYYIMNILDADTFLIHSDWSGKTSNPRFFMHSTEKLFRDGKELKYEQSIFAQMRPGNRITDYRFLVNGTDPLPEKTEVKCDFLDHIFVHDVVNPGAIVDYVKSHPGRNTLPPLQPRWEMLFVNTPELKKKYADFGKLQALATYHNRYRYEARGACVLYRKAEFKVALGSMRSLDTMLCWDGAFAQYPHQEFYIPKVKKMKLDGYQNHAPLECDFARIYKMPDSMPVNYFLKKSDCLNPEDMPDRFIRLCGDKKREIGIALGYSLIHGHSAKSNRGKSRKYGYYFWYTKKIYPQIYTLTGVRPGRKIETVSYKQYLNPQIEPDATAFYHHREYDADIIYLDFHRSLSRKKIRLPEAMTGKKLSVIEQTSSVTLHTKERIPSDGISLDVKGGYGYIVLKAE